MSTLFNEEKLVVISPGVGRGGDLVYYRCELISLLLY